MDLLKDDIYKLFIKYFFPTIGAALSTSIYVLFDTIFIGQGVGEYGLVALNIALPMYSVYFGTGLLLGIGGSTLFSIERGRGHESRANKIYTLSVVIGIVLSSLYTIIGLMFIDDIAIKLGATSEILPYVKEYMVAAMVGTIPFVMGSIFSAFVRADKAPKRAMIAVVSSGALNIVLDYIFVFPLNKGMSGAAFATVISYSISFIILFIHIFSKNSTLKFKRNFYAYEYIKRIVKCGLPSLFIEVSIGFVILIFNNRILKLLGADGVTAYSIISNTGIIAVALFNGISQTIQPLVSINYGAKQNLRVLKLKKIGISTAFIVGLIFSITCMTFPESIVHIFVKPTESVLSIAIGAIQIYSIAFIIMGINIVLGAFFQSIELSKEAFIISFCRGLLFVAILILILPLIIGIQGVWISVPLAETFTLIIGVILYKKRKYSLEVCAN